MILKKFALIPLLLMVGCASVPDNIKVAENTPLVSYEDAVLHSDANKNKMARWGGVIASVENLADTTTIELVHYPLRSYGRPQVGDQSLGRFRVHVNGFLDPMVYEKGRAITFTGLLKGLETGKVGEHEYRYPTLQAEGYHLWKEIQEVEFSAIHYWSWPFHAWHTYPVHSRVIIHSSGQKRRSTHSRPSPKPSVPKPSVGRVERK